LCLQKELDEIKAQLQAAQAASSATTTAAAAPPQQKQLQAAAQRLRKENETVKKVRVWLLRSRQTGANRRQLS
jgi:hypothetical protein